MSPRLSPLGALVLRRHEHEAAAQRVSNLERSLELMIGPRHNEETARSVAQAVLMSEPQEEYDGVTVGLIGELSEALRVALGKDVKHPRAFANMRLQEIRASYTS